MRAHKVVIMLVSGFLLASGFPGMPVAAGVDEADEQGHVEFQVWEGEVGCWVRVMVLVNMGGTCFQEDGDVEHEFVVEEGIQSIVVAMEWDPNDDIYTHYDDLKIRLTKVLEVFSVAGVTVQTIHEYDVRHGPPVLEFRVDAGDDGGEHDLGEVDGNWTLDFHVTANSSGGTPYILTNQAFTVHYHLFYGEKAPQGYSALSA